MGRWTALGGAVVWGWVRRPPVGLDCMTCSCSPGSRMEIVWGAALRRTVDGGSLRSLPAGGLVALGPDQGTGCLSEAGTGVGFQC